LEKHHRDEWQTISPASISPRAHLLHKDSDAERLIDNYKIGRQRTIAAPNNRTRRLSTISSSRSDRFSIHRLLAREFPARLRKISADQFENILSRFGDGNFNTLSSPTLCAR